ncbi:MAG: DedA family protein [Wolbachia endosymbiont of Meromenopon meropis]|nr:DedA family protein [Wolbachia endosymbiont of Meromenopon meropis]
MLYFKSYYNPLLMLVFGVLGSSLGGVINWYLGRITILIRESYHKLENRNKTQKIIKDLLICAVVILSWIQVLGSVIQVLSGCFKLNLSVFTLLTILSNFFHLLYLMITI